MHPLILGVVTPNGRGAESQNGAQSPQNAVEVRILGKLSFPGTASRP